MIRLAIVGVGWAGTRQVQAIEELASAGCNPFVVECLVDNDAEILRAKASELGVAKTHTDYRDALNDSSLDAVSICTPHALHCEMAVAAAEAGKHVLVEKPIALTVAEATRMICAAERNGVTLYVAENLTYAPMSRFLRELVQNGRYIGEVTCAVVVNGFRAPDFGYDGRRAWLTKPELGGTGTWMLHGVHSMAQLRYVLGEVETVYLREHKARSFARLDIEGTLTGTLTLESGVPVNVVQTCETHLPGNLGGYIIHGDRGSVRAWKDGCEIFSSELDSAQEPLRLNYDAQLSEYALEMEAFANTVAGVVCGPTDGVSERRSLAIVEAGYESARTGQPINLKQRFGDV
jgi:predicted dehydrogenase